MKLMDKAREFVGVGLGRPTVDEPDEQTPDDLIIETLDMIQGLKQESWEYMTACGDGESSLRDEWIDSANRFVGNFQTGSGTGDYATSRSEAYRVVPGRAINGRLGLKRAFLMRTQNSVMANTASAASRPVQGRLSPVEYGEEDMWFLTPRGGRIVSGAIKAATDARRAELEQLADESINQAVANPEDQDAEVTAEQAHHLMKTVEQYTEQEWGGLEPDQLEGENGPSRPIDEDQYELLMERVAQGLLPMRDSDFIGMTDTFISQRAQQACDILTDRANMPIYWLMYALRANITGFACGEFEWHTTGRFRHGLTFNISHPMNVFTDPCHWDMKYRAYHIEEAVLPVDRLVVEYPDFKKELQQVAHEGEQGSDDETTLGGTSENVNFRRKMVTVTTSWVRDQMVPMSAEDAVAEGRVVEQPVFTDEESMQPAYDEATGEPLKRYFLPGEDGEQVEVFPVEDVNHGTAWPDALGLRQIVSVKSARIVLQDVRCPYPDIPRVWSLNVPRGDDSPFGQGEPVRLKHIDEIINYTLSMLVNYLTSLGFPTCLWPKSLMAKMRKAGVPLNLRPNMHIPIEDADWQKLMMAGGTDKMKFKAEPLPASYASFLELMLSEHDTVSNNVPVRQGREPFSGASGKTIAKLQEGAESSLSIKSRLLEQSVVDFYRLLIHAIANWLPESEWEKMLNRYELPVVREIRRRIVQTQWDVTVKVSSGRGADEDADRENAITMYREQLLSPEDTLERLGEDDPQATARKAREYFAPGVPDDQQAAVQQAQVRGGGGVQ